MAIVNVLASCDASRAIVPPKNELLVHLVCRWSAVTVSRATRYGAEEHEQDVSHHPLAKHPPTDLAPHLRAGALQTSLEI